MKKVLLLLCAITVSFAQNSYAQSCSGDITILEDENLTIWEVNTNGTQVFSLAEFQGSVNIGGIDYFQDDFGFDARGLILMAHDLSGNLIWSRQITGTSFFTTNPALTATADNVFIAATSIESNGTVHELKVESFSGTDGTPSWSNAYQVDVTSSNLPFGAQVNPYSAVEDGNGRLIVSGAFSGPMVIGASSLNTTVGRSETFVMALDGASGSELWAVQSTGSNGRGRSWVVDVAPSNEIVVGGHFTGTIAFGAATHTAANNATTNAYLAKLNPATGASIWVRGFDNGSTASFGNILDVDFDASGNIGFVGNFNESINIIGNVINDAGLGSQALVGALDINGNYIWAASLGGVDAGVGAGIEFATTINYGASSNVYYAGVQLFTESLNYSPVGDLGFPPTFGHHVFGYGAADGSIDANPANNLSYENKFGYSSDYLTGVPENLIFASLNKNTGANIIITDWVPNRPIPLVNVTAEDELLNPGETLTAFDPGGGVYTYQWFKDGLPITDSTRSELVIGNVFLTNGSYYVEVAGSGGCARASNPIFLLDGTTLESDSLALVELYNTTNGPDWLDNTNWLVGNVNTWFGVGVNGGRVTDLFLSNNNLTGSISASIGALSALENIDFLGNSVGGTLPASFWNISTLNSIQFCCGNSIAGTISPAVGLLDLTVIDLGGNNFTGNLPPELFNNTNLQFINLWDDEDNGMNLTGSIPSTIGNLTSLNTLVIEGNQLTGAIPAEIGNAISLQEVNLRNNQLSGNLPDEIWQLPLIRFIQVDYNPELSVTLPTNLSSLTQLQVLGISGTVPIGGPFPTEFYSLTNLLVLDVGGHRFTGTINPEINDLVNLTGLWLFGNTLTGDFPAINSLTNLQAGSIAGNQFTSFPDISSLPVGYFEVNNNQLDFNSIIPNLGIADFRYIPQNRRSPDEYLEVDEGGDLLLINSYTTSGNQFTWVRNQQDTLALNDTQANYQITGATNNDLGGYFAYVTNSAAPDLTLTTPFYNVSSSVAPKAWTVDNSPGSVADFKSLYAAVYGTSSNDTLYVMGSQIPYNVGGKLIERTRVIYGPGYFLGNNPETQASIDTAYVNQLLFKKGAEGSVVSGLDLSSLFLNNNLSYINDTLTNVTLSHNRIEQLSIIDDNRDHIISKNFIEKILFVPVFTLNTSRSYQNLEFSNNIIDTVTTIVTRATASRNVMENVVFNRNTIGLLTDSLENITLTNNIINVNEATLVASESGTIDDFATANFENNSGTLSIDNDFQTTANAGAFSGADPYVLSGLAPIPHIFALNDIGRIRINVNAKNEVASNITFLNYRLGENGELKQRGTVRRLQPGNPVEVLFRPKLGEITPGATVNMMIWPRDANGVRGVPQNISFVAETTTASGQIVTSTGDPVTNGEVLLFEINQEATAFDTLATTLNNQGNFTFGNIVIGDYLALGKPNRTSFPGQLPTYFEATDLWEEADTLLIEATNPTFNIRLIEEPREETGPGQVAGFVEEELDQGNDPGGRINARGRVSGAGVTMRRARETGKGEETVYDLVDYVFTNENGEFFFENLPVADYRINIQYPGYPMDNETDVDIVIEASKNNDYNLEALVDEGKISVRIVSTTGLLDELVRKVNVYPNPAVETIKIEFTDAIQFKGQVNVNITSTTGEKVFEDNFRGEAINQSRLLEIPTYIYDAGTYILTIKNDNEILGTIRIALIR
ncbi:T9SS type A sorting domain-containing protein [Fulvivirga lutea]|uniref:T9SS type A sorting domain-containing protein n=1 Tax=Fulvivirga lutea TaxID=2810512 RepID=A0A974ZZ98_9BACT|nr:T9SS type A sorting domain-containing protein [Fulvivirga lutea]QSE95889.1 T9SS type A sorting domain-containing protein [Fulvivirga lutea]